MADVCCVAVSVACCSVACCVGGAPGGAGWGDWAGAAGSE